MMNEMKEILNEGGAPVFTTYAVEIGDSLWTALYNRVNETHKIEAVCSEDPQLFAVLQSREDDKYYRLNFSIVENEITFEEEVTEFDSYTPAEEPQFALADVEAFEVEFKKKKDEEDKDDDKKPEDDDEGKEDPKPEDDDDDEDDEEKKKKDKKAKYTLEEIPEYVELSTQYSELKEKYDALVAEKATQDATMAELVEFKKVAERKDKQEMINKFYMLSDDDKKDVVANIDTYSLDDIEAKLSIICVRNKVSFDLDDDKTPGTDPMTYNLNGGSLEDDATPAWIKAVMATAKTLN